MKIYEIYPHDSMHYRDAEYECGTGWFDAIARYYERIGTFGDEYSEEDRWNIPEAVSLTEREFVEMDEAKKPDVIVRRYADDGHYNVEDFHPVRGASFAIGINLRDRDDYEEVIRIRAEMRIGA